MSDISKAARNERLKLWATFFNNLSVGVLTGGILLPYYAYMQTINDVRERMLLVEKLASIDSLNNPYITGASGALLFAAMCRYWSNRFAGRIED